MLCIHQTCNNIHYGNLKYSQIIGEYLLFHQCLWNGWTYFNGWLLQSLCLIQFWFLSNFSWASVIFMIFSVSWTSKYFHIIICHLLWISAADTTDIILTTAAAACATIDIICCNLHMVLWSGLVVKIFWMWRSFFPCPWIKIIFSCLVLLSNLGEVGDLCQTTLN